VCVVVEPSPLGYGIADGKGAGVSGGGPTTRCTNALVHTP